MAIIMISRLSELLLLGRYGLRKDEKIQALKLARSTPESLENKCIRCKGEQAIGDTPLCRRCIRITIHNAHTNSAYIPYTENIF